MRKRLIPVLTVDRQRRLVKTVRFGQRTYVGDPFNVVRLFNEKEVDEICVLDIDATVDGREPDFGFLAELASECFMPLAYGGGLTTLAHCERLNRIGVEKFVLGSAALDPALVHAVSRDLGAQALVACVDVRGSGAEARCVTRSARRATGLVPLAHCLALQEAGVGEIVLQSVDRDGMREGYDLDLIAAVAPHLEVPVVALGGAGEAGHLAQALRAGASAAASGSAFSFIGRLRAVLVTYPDGAAMESISRAAA
ncbi:MAG: HisA/HisF-related TIM barrel protein [Caldimonas sp.]